MEENTVTSSLNGISTDQLGNRVVGVGRETVVRSPPPLFTAELEFLKSLWGLGTEEEKGYRTGPPGYIGWRNSFLGIDSWAP